MQPRTCSLTLSSVHCILIISLANLRCVTSGPGYTRSSLLGYTLPYASRDALLASRIPCPVCMDDREKAVVCAKIRQLMFESLVFADNLQ